MISSRNSLNTPSWSMPASSTPRSLTNFTRMTPFMEFAGNRRSWSYPSLLEKEAVLVGGTTGCNSGTNDTSAPLTLYLQHSWAADGDVGDVRWSRAGLDQAQTFFFLGDDVPEQQHPLRSEGLWLRGQKAKNRGHLLNRRRVFTHVFVWNDVWNVLQ